jgi:hypothetical protein
MDDRLAAAAINSAYFASLKTFAPRWEKDFTLKGKRALSNINWYRQQMGQAYVIVTSYNLR